MFTFKNPLLQLRCCGPKAAFSVFARSAHSFIAFYITIVIDKLCIKIKEGIEIRSIGGGDFDFENEKGFRYAVRGIDAYSSRF